VVLDRIVAENRGELEERKRRFTLADLEKAITRQPEPLDFASALRGERIRLIAEVKKASPSRGVICPDFDPVAIARIYAANGAAVISVLTEPKFFQGSPRHLSDIRKALGNRRIPLLRKDFIFEPYQIYESRACGADSLLLIVALLNPERLKELLRLSHQLGMGCLVEVHSEAELEIALDSGARVIGINNRDLRTFTVDLAISQRLRPLVRQDRITVSESGIRNRDDIKKLSQLGFDAVLIGETLLSAPDIAARMKELL